MAQNAMTRRGGGVFALRLDQFPSTQTFERSLNGAFRKPRRLSERAKTRQDRFPFVARGLAVKMQINKIRGRVLIVADDVAHQDIEDIIIDWNRFFEARHAILLNGQRFLVQNCGRFWTRTQPWN